MDGLEAEGHMVLKRLNVWNDPSIGCVSAGDGKRAWEVGRGRE